MSKGRLAVSILMSTLVSTFAQAAVLAAQTDKLDEARSYVEKKDYSGAYNKFHKLAKGGCPYSQCVMGIMHKSGVGTQQNLNQAIYWFKRSASQGFADAQNRLGKIYLQDLHNIPEATKWFQRAAEQDVAEAQYNLGKLEVNSGVAQVAVEGKTWLEKAASQGWKDGVNAGVNVVNKVPQIPLPKGAHANDDVASTLKQSWSGYSSLANQLDNGP